MFNPIRNIVRSELEKREEDAKPKKRRSSKKKRAAGIGAGAVTGGMMGLPVGLMGAVAMGLGRRKIHINPPKGALAQLKYFRGGGFAKDLAKGMSKAQREAMIGLGAGAGGGALMGGLAGHEISKQAAVIASKITPGSSSVRGYSYDKKSGSMLITFRNGGTYRYKGVSPAAAKAMGRNKSVGKTVHKRIKQGGYQYEKVGSKKKQKNYKCKFCKEPATKGVIWAEGRGIVPSCDKHLSKAKVSIDDPKDIDLIRDLTKTSSPKNPTAQERFYTDNPKNKKSAVIVMGNPKYIEGDSRADKFYAGLAKFVESKGYDVSFDPGTPHTSPKKADLWIGHSRGIDRLQYAPKGTVTIAMGSPDIKGSINHPLDRAAVGKTPTKHHYMLSSPMKQELSGRLEKTASGGYVLSEYTKKGDNASDRDVQRIDVHHKGKNVGFQTYHPGSDGDYVWVKSLYVDPKHRGKGVAKMLLDEVERKNKGKELRLRARPFRDKSVSAEGLKEMYGRRGYVQYDDKNRMVKTAEDEVEQISPLEPLPEETPISERVFQNLTMQAKTPQEEDATQGELVMDKMAQRRRGIAKMADVAKKQVTWQGLKMKLEHEKGDVRSGVNGATGKKWSRTMGDGYGYVPGTYGKGADGEAIDIYFNPKPVDDVATEVYKIRQKKKTGEYDEDKFMIGYASAAAARKAFLRNMPSWAFESMSSMGMKSFKTIVGQDGKKL
jgi:GNAT superfamily N-acetyltransferase